MSAENVKKLLCDLFALYKKAFARSNASGNGKLGQSLEGANKIRLFINGTNYDPKDKEQDTDVETKHCDDDCYKFCDDKLPTAYFWAYIKLIGITKFVYNNISNVGVESIDLISKHHWKK